jgi:hypothetical protein
MMKVKSLHVVTESGRDTYEDAELEVNLNELRIFEGGVYYCYLRSVVILYRFTPEEPQ